MNKDFRFRPDFFVNLSILDANVIYTAWYFYMNIIFQMSCSYFKKFQSYKPNAYFDNSSYFNVMRPGAYFV